MSDNVEVMGGLSPKAWDALVEELKKRGLDEEVAENVAAAIAGDPRVRDRSPEDPDFPEALKEVMDEIELSGLGIDAEAKEEIFATVINALPPTPPSLPPSPPTPPTAPRVTPPRPVTPPPMMELPAPGPVLGLFGPPMQEEEIRRISGAQMLLSLYDRDIRLFTHHAMIIRKLAEDAEKIQEALGDIELKDIAHVLIAFSHRLLADYDELLREVLFPGQEKTTQETLYNHIVRFRVARRLKAILEKELEEECESE